MLEEIPSTVLLAQGDVAAMTLSCSAEKMTNSQNVLTLDLCYDNGGNRIKACI